MSRLALGPALLAAALLASSPTAAQSAGDVATKIEAAIQMDYRTEEERARDGNRAPAEALAFMGLRDDMKVVEFIPARQAWYTKILAPVLAERGELHLVDSTRTFDSWGDLLSDPVFKTTRKIPIKLSYNREEFRYETDALNLGVTGADLFLNIREYHNFNAADRARLNRAAFSALKSGGGYVVIDHTRRHMQAEEELLRRREDPVQVIVEVQSAGFVLEKASDLFYRPVDTLDKEVGEFRGQTDRFFLVFRKP